MPRRLQEKRIAEQHFEVGVGVGWGWGWVDGCGGGGGGECPEDCKKRE